MSQGGNCFFFFLKKLFFLFSKILDFFNCSIRTNIFFDKTLTPCNFLLYEQILPSDFSGNFILMNLFKMKYKLFEIKDTNHKTKDVLLRS